jgi:hypothetical protein
MKDTINLPKNLDAIIRRARKMIEQEGGAGDFWSSVMDDEQNGYDVNLYVDDSPDSPISVVIYKVTDGRMSTDLYADITDFVI